MAVQASFGPNLYAPARPAPAAQFVRNRALKTVVAPESVEKRVAESWQWDRTRALVVWLPAHPHIVQLAQVCGACLTAARVACEGGAG